MDKSGLICIGHIAGVHGVKGWVKCYSNTSPRENIIQYSPWLIDQDGDLKAFDVNGKRQGKNILAQLEGVSDRSAAEQMIGCKLYMQADQLPELNADEYYWKDLQGLTVINQSEQILGKIDSMIETGANDVMLVQGDRERLIPFVMNEIVKQVDLEKGILIVDWQQDY